MSAAETIRLRFSSAFVVRSDFHIAFGVGTRWWWIGKLLGGLFGLGARSRVDRALARLEENRGRGDPEVDIVGFSRGSAISLHVTSKIQHAYGADQPIRFLGPFEVVGSFGIPGVRWNLGWDLEALPENVDVCCHALTLDEGRATFPLTRPSASPQRRHGCPRAVVRSVVSRPALRHR